MADISRFPQGVLEDLIVADPGNAGAIPVTASGTVPLVSAGAETRTLANPTIRGQKLKLICVTYVGDIVITAAGQINQATNTIMTFGVVLDEIILEAWPTDAVGATASLRWRVISNDGVALS